MTKAPFKIFIGWDARETLAYDVLCHSMRRNAKTHRVRPKPLKHAELRRKGIFRRPWLTEADTGNRIDLIDGKPFSTEFSHTRWLVPALCNYEGWALFLDCDMLFTDNVWKLAEYKDDSKAIVCVKHRHQPHEVLKMDHQPQQWYERKNWSSFMLINCGHPANHVLTPEYVSMARGRDLHGMGWLHDMQIGELPPTYNWIENCSPVVQGKPACIHYTTGGPWFDKDDVRDGAFFDLWEDEKRHWLKFGEDIALGHA